MEIRKFSVAIASLIAAQGSMAQIALEEVVVTAQKRVESAQTIPSTINAIDGEALRDFNLFNFTDLENVTAGLQIDRPTSRSGRIILRGVTFNPNSAAEAAVTTYWNRSLVDGNTIFQQMFDMERVEVTRGPQGSLSGRSSPGGAIHLHTVKPDAATGTNDGYIRATFSDNSGVNTQFGVSLPLVDGKLAMRIAGVFDESDRDEIRNDLTGEISNEKSKAGRISLNWLPTESVNVDLVYEYLSNDFRDVQTLSGTPTGNPVLDPMGQLRSIGEFDRRGASVGPDDTVDADFEQTSLVVNWELGDNTLSSITGYHTTDSSRDFDTSAGNANPQNVIRRVVRDDRVDFSQEIHFSNQGGGFWEYMVGLYYEDNEASFRQENFQPPSAPAFPGSVLVSFPVENKRIGIFTHNKLRLTDVLTLQVGLRWQETKTERDLGFFAGSNGLGPRPPGALIRNAFSESVKSAEQDAVTGSLSLQYQLRDELMLYGNFSTGWRPGAITVTGVGLPEELLLFGEEDSASYELGFKSTLLGGSLRLNGAIFFQDFENFITRNAAVEVIDINGRQALAGFTYNGDAEILGVEFEFDANLSEQWSVGGNMSYVDATWQDGVTQPCNLLDENGAPFIPDGESVATCDVSGDPIGGTPDFSLTMNSEYFIPFDGFEGYGRLLFRHTGERPDEELGDLSAYQTLDLYFGIRKDSWDVSVFARNLFDETEVRSGIRATGTVAGVPTGYGLRTLVPARLMGLSASYRF